MPHLGLIFLHSESAGGCNAGRVAPRLRRGSLTADTLRRTGSMAFFCGGVLIVDQTLPRITKAGRARTDRVTKDTVRSREKVSSGANFIFTFSDAMGSGCRIPPPKTINPELTFRSFLKLLSNARDDYSMEVRSDPFESAKSHFFDTSSWGAFCDVTLTLKQARQPDSGGWVRIDDYRCRQAFRHFMNLLNRAIYGAAFRRYGKSLRVLPVLEKGEVRARALRSWDRGTSGRWHIHCAIELPSHFDGIALENLIRDCWAKVEWGYGRILVRDGANAGWINYMLKDCQKSEFDGFVDCIIIESLHNPIADA